jgi:hypothetical protein
MNYSIRAESTQVIQTPQGQTLLVVQEGDSLRTYEFAFGEWQPMPFRERNIPSPGDAIGGNKCST